MSLHPHAKDQGSFSSGVFSIDSDVDTLNEDGECGDESHMESRCHPPGHEENFLSSGNNPNFRMFILGCRL